MHRFNTAKIVITYAILHLLWVLFVRTQPVSDFSYYFKLAQNLQAGLGYTWDGKPTAYGPVGFPAYLALLFQVLGQSLLAVTVCNVLLSVGVVYFMKKCMEELKLPVATQYFALLVFLIYPSSYYYCSLVSTEMLFTFLLMASCYGLLRMQYYRMWQNVFLGIVLGVATLVRPVILLLPVFYLGILSLVVPKKTVSQVIKTFFIYIGIFMVVLPWSYRNYKVFNRWVLVSTNGGMSFIMAHNPYATGGYTDHPKIYDGMKIIDNEALQDQEAYRAGKEFIKAHPGIFIKNAIRKIFILFKPVPEGLRWIVRGQPETQKLSERTLKIAFFLEVAFALFCWFGFALYLQDRILLTKREKRITEKSLPLLWPVLVLVYFTALHMIYLADPRYRIPLMPWLIVAAAMGYSAHVKIFKKSFLQRL